MSTTKELTCVVCPAGCNIKVELDGKGHIVSVTGNTCFRGRDYAESEITNPTRTLTSTVPLCFTEDSSPIMLPVRTSRPIPKSKLKEAMEIIHETKVVSKTGINTGDVIVDNLSRRLGIEGEADLIACKSVKPV